MHAEQVDFIKKIKNDYPEFFTGVSVLDVGSLDINGNNQQFFTKSNYTGIDIGPGPNVDIVKPIHKYKPLFKRYDVIMCCEMLEHDKYSALSIQNMIRLLKKGGMFVITAANEFRAEHGTIYYNPQDSPHTNEHYWPVFREDLTAALRLAQTFGIYKLYEDNVHGDIYFWGIKM